MPDADQLGSRGRRTADVDPSRLSSWGGMCIALITCGAMFGGCVTLMFTISMSWWLALAGASLTLLWCSAFALRFHRVRGVARVSLASSILAFVAIAWPRADHVPNATFRDVTLDGEPLGAAWFGLIPEWELVRFGVRFGLSSGERESVRGGTLLREIDDRIRSRPIVSQRTSRVLDAWLVDREHYRLALPDGPGPFPLLVFLHGNGGPFQFYPDALRGLARECGIAVALPSYGFGNWDNEPAQQRIDAVCEHVVANHSILADRIVLAGLSAGGIGVVHRASAGTGPYSAFVAISGFPPHDVELPDSLDGFPITLLTGEHDHRMPIDHAPELIERLRRAGANAQLQTLDADHFLMLTHADVVQARLLDALR